MPDTGPEKINPAGLMRCCIVSWHARLDTLRHNELHCDACGARLVRGHDGVWRWAGATDGRS